VEIRVRPLTGAVAISVVDTGVGIPKEDLNRVFDPFYQVESHLTRHHEGLGLGLAIARQVVRQHGGRIWAESVLGQGSRFIFTLPSVPRAKVEQEMEDAAEAEAEAQ
jgi:signal transduction histidine kinase